jgi:hypothetical protein
MATTGNDVFDIAMALTDNYAGGTPTSSDTTEYSERLVPIINNLLPELYRISDTVSVTAGTRPVPTFITALTDAIDLDDALARGVLPHGVIYSLFINDEPVMANLHLQLYQEKMAQFRNAPQEFSAIEDVYGISDYSRYADNG